MAKVIKKSDVDDPMKFAYKAFSDSIDEDILSEVRMSMSRSALQDAISTEVIHTINCTRCEVYSVVRCATRTEAAREFKVRGWDVRGVEVLCPKH